MVRPAYLIRISLCRLVVRVVCMISVLSPGQGLKCSTESETVIVNEPERSPLTGTTRGPRWPLVIFRAHSSASIEAPGFRHKT